MAEQQLTRYLIFETDERALAFNRIGEQLARSSEEAVRKHYSTPPVSDEDAAFVVAVSENAFKLRRVKAKVQTQLSDLTIPELGAKEVQSEVLAEPESLPV